ncbi:MAG: 16S rRNA (cytosine(1402)-N(4))-methyltransferase RsmH [Planctomycetales bacterium]
MGESEHISVLPKETVELLQPQPGQVIVDGTLGAGGHAKTLADAVGSTGLIIGLDRDQQAIDAAEVTYAGMPMMLVHANFCELPEVLDQLEIDCVDAVLLDLGLSSDQLADDQRGFSFQSDGPLDMRFDPTSGEPVSRLVNRLSAEKLAAVIYEYGEERHSRRIAQAIVRARQEQPIETSGQLADIVSRAVPPSGGRRRIHPATRTFQALRIAVNEELKSLDVALRRIPSRLRKGGRMAVISFHSLEDRRVKEAFRDDPEMETLTKRPIRPTEEEIDRNPRARSAKLRVASRRE